jgi:hypothetical protein
MSARLWRPIHRWIELASENGEWPALTSRLMLYSLAKYPRINAHELVQETIRRILHHPYAHTGDDSLFGILCAALDELALRDPQETEEATEASFF